MDEGGTMRYACRLTFIARGIASVAGALSMIALMGLLTQGHAQTAVTELNSGYSWVPIGPLPMTNQLPNFGGYIPGPPLPNATGRITSLAVDPQTSGQTIFVGAAGGGRMGKR